MPNLQLKSENRK